MERRDFIRSAALAGAAGLAVGKLGEASAAPAVQKRSFEHPKTIERGVSLYCYSDVLGKTMTLEDCFADIADTGSTCFEMLTSHIENYPNPSTQWIDHYWGLCDKYNLKPAEMGHWCETHLSRGPKMTHEEIKHNMVRDFKLANILGFRNLRTKFTTINVHCDPEPGWQDMIAMLLPYAEKYDVKMQNEVHQPTTLKRQHILDYVEFIEKHQTEYFGLNIDFSIFQNAWPKKVFADNPYVTMAKALQKDPSKPDEIREFLKYSRACHAKFNYVSEDFEELTIPYKEIMKEIIDAGWTGYIVSEFEGANRGDRGVLGEQLRRQHIMLDRMLGNQEG